MGSLVTAGIIGFLVCLFVASIIEVVRTHAHLKDERKARQLAEENLKASHAMIDNLSDIKGAIRREFGKAQESSQVQVEPKGSSLEVKACPGCHHVDILVDHWWPHCANCNLGTQITDWDLSPNILRLRKRSEQEQISLWNTCLKGRIR